MDSTSVYSRNFNCVYLTYVFLFSFTIEKCLDNVFNIFSFSSTGWRRWVTIFAWTNGFNKRFRQKQLEVRSKIERLKASTFCWIRSVAVTCGTRLRSWWHLCSSITPIIMCYCGILFLFHLQNLTKAAVLKIKRLLFLLWKKLYCYQKIEKFASAGKSSVNMHYEVTLHERSLAIPFVDWTLLILNC